MLKMGFEVAVFLFSLTVSLPASIALFPQTGCVDARMVEEELIKGQEVR
jgi:hypothetical protein